MTLNSQITALHSIGADAMDNLYDVYITLPEVLTDESANNIPGNIADHFRLRAEGFTPPQFTQKKYEVRYKTVKMNRPAALVEGDRTFELTFRMDAYYRVYHALLAWRSLLFEPTVGYANQSLPDVDEEGDHYGTVAVYTMVRPPARVRGEGYTSRGITANGFGPEESGEATNPITTGDFWDNDESGNATVHKAWEFRQVWISELTEPEFSNSGGETQKIKATFEFGEYRSPAADFTAR